MSSTSVLSFWKSGAVSPMLPGQMPAGTDRQIETEGTLKAPPQTQADAAASASEFESLAMPLAQVLYATAYRITGNSARAEDLVQETFVRAWQKFSSFTRGSNFKAWIFKILIFLSRNEGRAARHQPVSLDAENSTPVRAASASAPAYVPPKGSGGWNALYDSIVDDEFRNALARLDEDHRSVLMLFTLGELSYQECAEALEIPVGTVMSRLFRARKQLQADLAEYARNKGIFRGQQKNTGREHGGESQ
jgi:RNA polymerase sigma-70 factor, ECF subfamily